MCGISGIVTFGRQSADHDLLHRLCESMRHRGPDDSGCWAFESPEMSVGFAHTRLSVIDPTPSGRQPMVDAGHRLAIVFNGEIYNHRDLRRELESSGFRFTTHSDTEVILGAFARWGEEAFQRLSGMWALCIFDQQSGQGRLVRDPFGIKPLVYARCRSGFCFASEMKTLRLISGWDDEIDQSSLVHYLHYGYFGGSGTIYRGVRRLPPGHLARFDASGLGDPVRYFTPKCEPLSPSYEEACEQVRWRLDAAVQSHCISDVPLGAFLSGGLDSSILAAHIVRHARRPVKTFSIGFVEHGHYDETEFARVMAERLETEHHAFRLRFADVLSALPDILDHLQEPFGDSSIVPTSLVSALARTHVTVALSGDGGDEVFGGYRRYQGHAYLRAFRRLPEWLRSAVVAPALDRLPSSKSNRWMDRIRMVRKLLRARDSSALANHLAWSRIAAPEVARTLLDPAVADSFAAAMVETATALLDVAGAGVDHDPLNAILLFDLLYNLPGDMLQKVDIASMRHGLEVRVPFLDPAVVQFACGLPSSYKIAGTRLKRILVDAYADILPVEVLRRRKMGFELPFGEFLRGPLKPMFTDVVRREVVESLGILNWSGVGRIYEEHCQRRAEHGDLLYAILSLCWWRQRRQSCGRPASWPAISGTAGAL